LSSLAAVRTALWPAKGRGARPSGPSLFTRRTVPEGIRITKVGLWYIVLTILVAVPAANTGNNALYLVEAFLLALLVVSGVASRQNLRRLELDFEPPAEIYAKQPFSVRYTVHNRGRLMSRRLLVVAGVGESKPTLIPHIPIEGTDRGLMEVQVEQRGIHKVPFLHFSSIFPLGLFRKGLRYRIDLELLVYPEVDTTGSFSLEQLGVREKFLRKMQGPATTCCLSVASGKGTTGGGSTGSRRRGPATLFSWRGLLTEADGSPSSSTTLSVDWRTPRTPCASSVW
jgi:hypothetical protein